MATKFDHDLARELYRGGALIEALAVKFGVTEQAVRFAVIPGERERHKQTRLRRQQCLRELRETQGVGTEEV